MKFEELIKELHYLELRKVFLSKPKGLREDTRAIAEVENKLIEVKAKIVKLSKGVE